MATQFTAPSGDPGPAQRTPSVPGVTNSPNPLAAMKGSGKAAECAPTSTEGADAMKARGQAGQTLDKTPGKLVEPVPAIDGSPTCLPGGGYCSTPASNVESTPPGYPRNAPSRHPNAGSSTLDKSKNLAKIRRK